MILSAFYVNICNVIENVVKFHQSIFLNMNFNHKFKYSENGRTIVCSKRDEKIKPKCKEGF